MKDNFKPTDMKTRVAYFVVIYRHIGKPHAQYILPNELYLLATWLKDTDEYSHAEVFREELSISHWLFT